jgi:hypothetical protein
MMFVQDKRIQKPLWVSARYQQFVNLLRLNSDMPNGQDSYKQVYK